MRNILVTGGNGFLGKHVVELLKESFTVYSPKMEDYDFRMQHHALSFFGTYEPKIVINLAAAVGGIRANLANPGSFFYDNLIIGMNLMEVARQYNVKKFVQMGSACEYPRDVRMPMLEKDVWDGYPEASNSSYAIAKRALLEMGQAYRKQYGMNVIHILSTNLFGPGDNFDLATSHVIPALIHRCLTQQDVTVWGSGNATRDFLYVKDAAEAIVRLTGCYNESEPINIGSDREVSIRQLAELVGEATDFKGTFEFDSSKPDGQPRRVLNVQRAAHCGIQAKTKLEDGLRETVQWFKNEKSL